MFDDPRLLVVDDEEVICRGCRRIFSGQGFRVETSTDAREGLSLAAQNDYLAILLDMKMPTMDGIKFLEELRKTKPNTPVIVITGYPSTSNVASAKRLGAVEYITKPFTPEEVTQPVLKLKQAHDGKIQAPSSPVSPSAVLPEVEPSALPAEKGFFWDESWIELGKEGSARVGAMLTRAQAASVIAVRLPRVGDTVYQGLPLAGLTMADRSQMIVPSPLSGVVLATNEMWAESPSTLWNDPDGNDWLASIAPARFEEEIKKCGLRRLILFNADERSARDQEQRLAALGCRVRIVETWNELVPALKDPDCNVLVMDAASVRERGPDLVGQINAMAPLMKVVVVGGPEPRSEGEYRKRRIFYYAVEPFGDNEVIDILVAAFRPQAQTLERSDDRKAFSESVSRLRITNGNGTKVCLLVGKGLMGREDGLGWRVRSKLLDRLYPIETTLGSASITPIGILDAASTCDRLLVLRTKDTGRLPGSLVRDSGGEGGLFSTLVEETGKVTSLAVQPASPERGTIGFDTRTTIALAEHIVNEMASC